MPVWKFQLQICFNYLNNDLSYLYIWRFIMLILFLLQTIIWLWAGGRADVMNHRRMMNGNKSVIITHNRIFVELKENNEFIPNIYLSADKSM